MKIYVRERTRAGEGGSRHPRYKVLAIEGGDLRLYAEHFRKKEIEQIGSDLGADIVYISSESTHGEGKGHKGDK